jgi:hypothetical protein
MATQQAVIKGEIDIFLKRLGWNRESRRKYFKSLRLEAKELKKRDLRINRRKRLEETKGNSC